MSSAPTLFLTKQGFVQVHVPTKRMRIRSFVCQSFAGTPGEYVPIIVGPTQVTTAAGRLHGINEFFTPFT